MKVLTNTCKYGKSGHLYIFTSLKHNGCFWSAIFRDSFLYHINDTNSMYNVRPSSSDFFSVETLLAKPLKGWADLFWGGPFRFQFILVDTPLENPAQAWHGFYPVQQGWVVARVLVPLHIKELNIISYQYLIIILSCRVKNFRQIINSGYETSVPLQDQIFWVVCEAIINDYVTCTVYGMELKIDILINMVQSHLCGNLLSSNLYQLALNLQ